MSAFSDLPRQKLSEIVSAYGAAICEDSRLCRALLRDACPANEREVALLLHALDQKVPQELLASNGSTERDGVLFSLVRRLVVQLGVTEAEAIWVIESWSSALSTIGTPAIPSTAITTTLNLSHSQPGTQSHLSTDAHLDEPHRTSDDLDQIKPQEPSQQKIALIPPLPYGAVLVLFGVLIPTALFGLVMLFGWREVTSLVGLASAVVWIVINEDNLSPDLLGNSPGWIATAGFIAGVWLANTLGIGWLWGFLGGLCALVLCYVWTLIWRFSSAMKAGQPVLTAFTPWRIYLVAGCAILASGVLAQKSPTHDRERGDEMLKSKDYTGAVAAYSKAIKANPEDGKAFVGRGEAYSKLGNYDQAIEDFTEAIRLNPRNATAYGGRGVAYRDKQDMQRSRADFEMAERIHEEDAHAALAKGLTPAQLHFNRGIDFSKKKEYQKAVEAFTEAVRLDPKYADAFEARGVAYADQGKFDLAIEDYAKAIDCNPRLESAYYNRGLAFAKKRDFESAIPDFTQAIRLNPKHALSYFQRGYCFSRKTEREKAIADYTDAIRLDPKLAIAYYNRGLLYDAKGEQAKAKADMEEARRLDPNIDKEK